PQLEDRVCVILVDGNNLERVFYKNIDDQDRKFNHDLISNIQNSLEISMPEDSDFEKIIEALVNS
ncbi:MAG: hypothetical protein ACYSR7_05025, partial [Planctomycetota bacterium]